MSGIVKDPDGVYWLEVTPDPTVELWYVETPTGVTRTFAPKDDRVKLGKGLTEPVTATLIPADVVRRAPQMYTYPPLAPPAPPTSAAFAQPAWGHKWGGNTQQAMRVCDLVIASFFTDGDAVEARKTNPGLVAFSHPSLDPQKPEWYLRRGYAFTYGSGLRGGAAATGQPVLPPWPGVVDTLQPNPIGSIRGWADTDLGCRQADGLWGFAIEKPATAELVEQATWYAWKAGEGARRGYDGVWSDNLIPGNLIRAGWFYGTCGTGKESAWDTGLKTILGGLLNRGVPVVGGNVVFRGTDPALLALAGTAEHEVLEHTIAQGQAGFSALLAEVQRWNPNGDKHLLVMHKTPQSDTVGMRFGLALTCILGGAYCPYQSHSDLYQPVEMQPRGRLGRPRGPAVRSGNKWTRQFEAGAVSADFDTKTATFDQLAR